MTEFRRYIAKRDWFFPFVVGVWDTRWLEGHHWKKGHYWLWHRRGAFFTRRKANEFIAALERDPRLTT